MDYGDYEQEKVPYQCINAGHTVGSRTFLKAPPEWFLTRGYDLPKNCGPCKAWRNSQVDEKLRCNSCRRMHLVTAGEKRLIHREDGPYKPPTLCKDCVENPRPASADGFSRRDKKFLKKQSQKEIKFSDLPQGTINSLSVMVSASDYQHRVPRVPTDAEVKVWKARAQAEGKTLEQYKQELIARGEWSPTATRQEHIERHVEGSSNQDPYRTPSVLAPVGASFEDAMAVISAACQSTDTNHVRQYRQPDGKIVRLSFTGDHDGLEKTILKQTASGLEVVTSFDGLTSAEAHKRVGNVWK